MEASRIIQKKRTSNFREDETKLLIQLWGSPQIQNKLYLTHRKAPVMRILAASMQQHGFYRTPDEIKTRIRNLKCLYHRIKRSMQSGAGLGTIDPDWPHFKTMDDILSKQSQRKDSPYKDNIFEGPRCEDIKQEIEDIDINDDMESYTTNSLAGSDYEDESQQSHLPLPPLTPAPSKETRKEPELTITKTTNVSKPTQFQSGQSKPLPSLLPSLSIPIQNQQVSTTNGVKPGTLPSLPFPLLILNGLQPQMQQSGSSDQKTTPNNMTNIALSNACAGIKQFNGGDLSGYLKELTEIQREKLKVEKQRLELDKQRLEHEKRRLEFEQAIRSQLSALAPLFTDIMNSHKDSLREKPFLEAFSRKRVYETDGNPQDGKILRSFLQTTIKKSPSDDEYDEVSENESIHDENTISDK